MNVRYAIYALLMMLSFALAACSADDTSAPAEERIPVAFTTGFSGMTRSTTIENAWTSGDAIAVTNGIATHRYTAAANSEVGGAVNLTFGDYESQFFWPNDEPHWSFTAWYPYQATQHTSVNLAADQRSTSVDMPADGGTLTADAYRQYDLLFCPAVSSTIRKRVHLLFYHQLAHVVVNATVSTKSGTTTEQVTGILLGSENVAVTGALTMGTTGTSVETPTISWTVNTSDQTNTIKMRHTATTGSLFKFESMLPPQTIGDSDTPLLTVTTTDGTLTRTYIYKAPCTLRAGYEYTITLTINELGILKVETLQIASWNTGTNGTGIVR